MSNSVNEDQEPSKMTGNDKSSAMTIDFLRARLLSERSVSKSARQRADELAKRVAELEEQLNFVSLQRKKAEKATADALAILENHGISDAAEKFDSNSEHDETPHDFKSDNGSLTTKEASANTKLRSNEAEVYSSSEIESSPSTGRSLSWKSVKDSQNSLEKKKCIESVRRRATFTSNSSSARRVGKSCRRIRRRETRSMVELHNDSNEKAMRSADVSNCSDNGSVVLREGSGFDNGKGQLESTELGPDSETQKDNGQNYSGHERDEDMESALQHQAQLIFQYEEEEKAQREWEQKFRENNNGAQESGDPGNHSDVTEERYEMELPKLASSAAEPSIARLCPMTNPRFPGVCLLQLTLTREENWMRNPMGVSNTPHAIPATSPLLELTVVPRETSNNLGPVLEALQQAKLSLNQRLHSLAPVAREASVSTIKASNPDTHYMDCFNSPLVSPGLFRLPTDTQFEATTQTRSGPSMQSTLVNYLPETAPSRPLTVPYRSFTPEFSLGAPPPSRSFSQPQLSEGSPSFYRSIRLNPHQLVKDTYPYLPVITLHVPLNDEGPSRTFPSSEGGLAPPVATYNDSFRPNMHYR